MQFQTESILNSLSTLKTAADIGLTAGSGFLIRNGMFYNVKTREMSGDFILNRDKTHIEQYLYIGE